MLSGKFVLRVDPKLHKALRDEALQKGESLNSLCIQKILGLNDSTNSAWSELVLNIRAEFSPVGIALFGSVARGEQTANSDIDLLIVLPEQQPITRDVYKKWDRLKFINSKLSPQFVHLPKADAPVGSIWLENAMEAEILYDHAGIVKKTFLEIRRKVSLGLYVRKQSYGQSYWIRRDADAE